MQVIVVAAKESGLTEELVAAHNCVVFTVFTPIEELLRWNKFCRSQKQPISFIYCFSAGTAGSLFVDHGPGFVMRDADGKNPLVKMINEVRALYATMCQEESSLRMGDWPFSPVLLMVVGVVCLRSAGDSG